MATNIGIGIANAIGFNRRKIKVGPPPGPAINLISKKETIMGWNTDDP
jgi:hypothetical protein